MRLKDLEDLSDEEFKAKLDQFVEESNKPEVQAANLEKLRSEILAREQRYKMTTVEMMQALKEDRIEETSEICSWLIDADLYQRVTGQLP